MCWRSELFGPTLWKCGSMDVTSEATPIFSSCAIAGAPKPSAPAPRREQAASSRDSSISPCGGPASARVPQNLER